MKREMNNKGFSLVELIIVIAIMAVLMGILAPQYLKYVKQSKISTDITNAEEIATAINVTVADSVNPSSDSVMIAETATSIGAGTTIVSKSSGGSIVAPASKTDSSYTWDITWDTKDGCKEIKLGGKVIWPTSTDFQTNN